MWGRFLFSVAAGLALITSCTGSVTTDADAEPELDGSTATDGGESLDAEPEADGAVGSDTGPPGPCFDATRLWFEDFETGDYSRWTSMTYDAAWDGGNCHGNGFSTDESVSPTRSHRSEITCRSRESVHRGYGGLQFDGDSVVGAYTNRGAGIVAPNGVVTTFWTHLHAPDSFGGGRWFSLWTVDGDCTWGEEVVTLGLEDSSHALAPAHVASTTYGDRPPLPLDEWVRITVYVNFYDGTMHVWQNGEWVSESSFSRATRSICQWHWGAYASGDNTNIVLYEDDKSIWKLNEAWTDFSVEPYFGVTHAVCR